MKKTAFPETAYGVTPEMCTADFWINKLPEPDRILLTEDEMETLNQKIFDTKECHIFDMHKADSILAENSGIGYGLITRTTCLRCNASEGRQKNSISVLCVNDPVVLLHVSENKRFFYVRAEIEEGWVRKEHVALCHSREEWLQMWDLPASQMLTVTGSAVHTNAYTSKRSPIHYELRQGTRLPLKEYFPAQMETPSVPADGLPREDCPFLSYYRIAVVVPDRAADGSFLARTIWVPQHEQPHIAIGWPAFSQRNLLKFAFSRLGDPYGWGGEYGYGDCGTFIRDVYRCFGIKMPINTTRIAALPVYHDRIAHLTYGNDRQKVLDNLPAGAIIHLWRHTMLYLGQHEGNDYTISNTRDIVRTEDDVHTVIDGVSIFAMNTKRLSGANWLLTLQATTVPQRKDPQENAT